MQEVISIGFKLYQEHLPTSFYCLDGAEARHKVDWIVFVLLPHHHLA